MNSVSRNRSDHDVSAFAGHVHPQAAFGVKGPQPTRGRDIIVKEWAGIISGEQLELQRYPTMVVVPGETGVAYSSGPALYRSQDDKGQERVSLGGFQSIWTRGDDGVWRVLYDDGTSGAGGCGQVAAFTAGRRTACPCG